MTEDFNTRTALTLLGTLACPIGTAKKGDRNLHSCSRNDCEGLQDQSEHLLTILDPCRRPILQAPGETIVGHPIRYDNAIL